MGVSDVGVRALAPLMRRMQRLDLSFLDRGVSSYTLRGVRAKTHSSTSGKVCAAKELGAHREVGYHRVPPHRR